VGAGSESACACATGKLESAKQRVCAGLNQRVAARQGQPQKQRVRPREFRFSFIFIFLFRFSFLFFLFEQLKVALQFKWRMPFATLLAHN